MTVDDNHDDRTQLDIQEVIRVDVPQTQSLALDIRVDVPLWKLSISVIEQWIEKKCFLHHSMGKTHVDFREYVNMSNIPTHHHPISLMGRRRWALSVWTEHLALFYNRALKCKIYTERDRHTHNNKATCLTFFHPSSITYSLYTKYLKNHFIWVLFFFFFQNQELSLIALSPFTWVRFY